MRRLVLFLLTTSRVKAAHLSYLLSLHGIVPRTWPGFRGYPELQVENAAPSLLAGAAYIRARFNRPFIIEDTEVRLDAYSAASGINYPGFDIKRWWRVTTFEEIDQRCKHAGTRAVQQTSNLCLSIPGLPPAIFSGTVKGHVAEQPYSGPGENQPIWLRPSEFGAIFYPLVPTCPSPPCLWRSRCALTSESALSTKP